jgi:putative peptidoglycan lipid II flippase
MADFVFAKPTLLLVRPRASGPSTRSMMPEGGADFQHQVVRALGSIGAATLASRLLGFARDMAVALVFGAGPVTDAFFVAFRIPNVLRRLLAEGALSTAIVPVFTEYVATRSSEEFIRMLRSVLGAALVVLTLVAALGIATAPWLLAVIAPGFAADPAQASLTVLLVRVMFPYLILVGLGALAMGALNTHGQFFASALGPALLNVGMIAATLWLSSRVEPPILALALGVLVGGAAQLAAQVPSLRRSGLLVSPSADLLHPVLPRMARLLLPAVFGLAAVQVSVLVNTLLASLLPAGSISFLYYADRVMEFPLGVFGIALASASLPAMARQAATGDTRALAGTLNFALRLSLYVAVPATVGLIVLRTPITRVLFERGQFGAADTLATARALGWYAIGLVGFSGARIVAQSFYAAGAPGAAVRLGIASVLVSVAAAVALMGPMAHTGLAFASSLGAWANLVLLLIAARRRFGRLGGRALLASGLRALAASAPLALWCALLGWAWPSPPTRALEAAWLAAAVAGGGAAFYAGTIALRMPERIELLGALSARRRR